MNVINTPATQCPKVDNSVNYEPRYTKVCRKHLHLILITGILLTILGKKIRSEIVKFSRKIFQVGKCKPPTFWKVSSASFSTHMYMYHICIFVYRTWVPCFDSSFIKEDNLLCNSEPCLQYIVKSLPYYIIIISERLQDITFNQRFWKIDLVQFEVARFLGRALQS